MLLWASNYFWNFQFTLSFHASSLLPLHPLLQAKVKDQRREHANVGLGRGGDLKQSTGHRRRTSQYPLPFMLSVFPLEDSMFLPILLALNEPTIPLTPFSAWFVSGWESLNVSLSVSVCICLC